jgi:hypothetical protein|tara:strand:- start:275 stop:451 length:177 start_codon:yes stop_codon:yes gene_type:complete
MWKVDVIESEAGWGQRVDEVKEFDNEQAAVDFKDSFNAENNLDQVPDWYMYATDPYKG